VGENTWQQWWHGLPSFSADGREIADWLIDSGHLERDSGMLFIGPQAERRYGRKNLLDWKRRRCFVDPSDVRASMGWSGSTAPLSFALCRSERDALLGTILR
jgi:ATP-dependent Lhr-like helicase